MTVIGLETKNSCGSNSSIKCWTTYILLMVHLLCHYTVTERLGHNYNSHCTVNLG